MSDFNNRRRSLVKKKRKTVLSNVISCTMIGYHRVLAKKSITFSKDKDAAFLVPFSILIVGLEDKRCKSTKRSDFLTTSFENGRNGYPNGRIGN